MVKDGSGAVVEAGYRAVVGRRGRVCPETGRGPLPEPAVYTKGGEPTVPLDRVADAWAIAEPLRDRPEPGRLRTVLAAVADLWVDQFVTPAEAEKAAWRAPGVPYRLTGADFHRVQLRDATSWSLFVHGPFIKGWGFLRPALIDNAAAVRFDAPSNWDMDEMRFWRSAQRGRTVKRAAP